MSRYDNFLVKAIKNGYLGITQDKKVADKLFINFCNEEYSLEKTNLSIITLYPVDYLKIYENIVYMLGNNKYSRSDFNYVFKKEQIDKLLLIKEHPEKDYVLNLYNPKTKKVIKGKELHFVLEGKRLHVNLMQASTNLYRVDAIDKLKYSILVNILCNVLDLKPGKFIQQTTRAYVKKADLSNMRNITARTPRNTMNLEFIIKEKIKDIRNIDPSIFKLVNYTPCVGNLDFEKAYMKKYNAKYDI